jgi:hypothetical protein
MRSLNQATKEPRACYLEDWGEGLATVFRAPVVADCNPFIASAKLHTAFACMAEFYLSLLARGIH